jgi:hypothetical protein
VAARSPGLLVVPTVPARDAEDGCKAGEDGNGKENPGHDEPPLRCRGVLTRLRGCLPPCPSLRHPSILPSPSQ